jgi:hypothetical protein
VGSERHRDDRVGSRAGALSDRSLGMAVEPTYPYPA